MRAKFKLKKRIKFKLKKIIFIIFIIYIMNISLSYLTQLLVPKLENEKIVDIILQKNESVFDAENLNTPEFIFSYAFGMDLIYSEPVIKTDNIKEIPMDPTVYIYNAHPTEKYSYESYEAFNINPTVVTASYILSEYLYDYNIVSLVETNDVVEVLNSNSWSYSKSYDAARILMEDTTSKYETINYFIDIHRDSSSYDITTIDINGKACARFLFVIGLDNPNYELNLTLVTDLNNVLNEINPSFTRGIMKKQGAGINGVYNQDFHKNTILIEVGGQYNSIDEVNCSLIYLAESLKKVIDSGKY